MNITYSKTSSAKLSSVCVCVFKKEILFVWITSASHIRDLSKNQGKIQKDS